MLARRPASTTGRPALVLAAVFACFAGLVCCSARPFSRVGGWPNSRVGARARAAGARRNTFDVADYGAKPDNATDNSAAFQSALDACSSAGGGEVFAGSGIFRFRGSFSVPPGCTLSGTYTIVPSHDLRGSESPAQVLNDGTVLLPTEAAPSGCDLNCTDYFLNVGPNGALRGLVIYYGEQETKETPRIRGPSIWESKKRYGDMNNAAVTDIELLGAWNGVAAVAAHRHYIARVRVNPSILVCLSTKLTT